ncbi:hypothetical protein ACKC9G_12060 [Pokkaliibacter sp. CJK22405]|uniref:hypothetical protein n=1 Tax=Pokkaliibacter sp. CJK22405 TaxID=3384615 RepID=UPI0039849BDE
MESRRKWWRWQRGRQQGGYDKLLLATLRWPVPWDCYLLRFPEGSVIPPHQDKVVTGRHFRLNIVLRKAKRGGEFVCSQTLFSTSRIKLFRPDKVIHEVSRVEQGSRYLLGIGWVLKQ